MTCGATGMRPWKMMTAAAAAWVGMALVALFVAVAVAGWALAPVGAAWANGIGDTGAQDVSTGAVEGAEGIEAAGTEGVASSAADGVTWVVPAGMVEGDANLVSQVSERADTARMDQGRFAIEDFSRAQKGSNRPIAFTDQDEAVYQGYAYLLGSEGRDVIMIATARYVVVYVNPQVAEGFGGIEQTGEGSFLHQLVSFLLRLDQETCNGSAVISPDVTWVFTTSQVCEVEGVQFRFNQELKEGYFYASFIGADGSDVTDSANPYYVDVTHADFCNLSASDEVTVAVAPTGLAAVQRFLTELDWRPLLVTLKTTFTAIVFVFILGLLAAWWSLRIPSRAQDIADSIFTIPMVLPPTVCGFLLLLLLGKNTALGQFFIDVGFPLVFSWPATVIAATVVAFPLMYRSARGAFEGIDPNMLDAARTLGWSESKIFFRLMLPLTWSSIAAGTVLSFARALGEFGATLFLAGNYAGITRTVSIAIYFEWMNGNIETALFWTGVILVFSFFVILFINLWSRRTTKYRRREG